MQRELEDLQPNDGEGIASDRWSGHNRMSDG